MEGLPRSKQLTIFAIAFVAVGLFAIGSFTNARNRRNQNAEEYVSPNTPAILSNAEELYKTIDNDRQFSALREDITSYARLAMPQYFTKDGSQIGFEVLGLVENKNDEIKFTGKYDEDSDRISVSIKKLSSDRIKTSITNQANNGNIDSRLPSNSKENQFIGGLPFRNDLFSIEYNSSTKSFTITALSPDPSVRQQATDYITNSTGKPKAGLKILFKPYLF